MRIAFSGSHRVGKTALAEAVAEVLYGRELIEEPYRLLEEDGYEFSDPPTVEDFEAQLERALESAKDQAKMVLFDRCPVDFLAYLLALDHAYDVEEWLPRVREALATFDFVVHVPIEAPDRIALGAGEDPDFRADVAERLAEILGDDTYRLGTDVVEVRGDVAARMAQVVARVR